MKRRTATSTVIWRASERCKELFSAAIPPRGGRSRGSPSQWLGFVHHTTERRVAPVGRAAGLPQPRLAAGGRLEGERRGGGALPRLAAGNPTAPRGGVGAARRPRLCFGCARSSSARLKVTVRTLSSPLSERYSFPCFPRSIR